MLHMLPDAFWQGGVMRITALVLNVVMVCVTMSVIFSEGMSPSHWYQLFTLMVLAIPLMTAQTLWKFRAPGAITRWERQYVGGLNVLLFVLIGAAIVDQYPHSREAGFIPYIVLACLVPVLNAWVLLRRPGALPAA
jgi:hypothetical protein